MRTAPVKETRDDVQVIADPLRGLLWASPGLPGAIHDVHAAREHGIPCRGQFEALSAEQEAVNRSHANSSTGRAGHRYPQELATPSQTAVLNHPDH
jgi:hypothetical protein